MTLNSVDGGSRRSTRRWAKRLQVALASAFGILAIAGSSTAGGATTVGATFVPSLSLCNTTMLQTTSPNGQYTVPFSGVITSWSYQAGGAPPLVSFKVGRSAGGNSFSIIGTSPLMSQGPSVLNNHPIRIPVQAGDVIGAYGNGAGTCNIVGGYDVHYASGDQPVGGPITYQALSNFQLDVAAALEPDAENDGFGDETQDKCVGTTGTANGCSSTVAIDKLKQKGKKPKVAVTATIPGAGTLAASSSSLQPVTLTPTSTSQQQLTLTLKLTKSARRKLAEKGKLRVAVEVVYTPIGGPPASQTKKTKLKS